MNLVINVNDQKPTKGPQATLSTSQQLPEVEFGLYAPKNHTAT